MSPIQLRAAGSGSTVLAVAFGTLLERFGSASALLTGREGNPMDVIARVATCVGPDGSEPGCSRHFCVGGGAVVWEGDAYAILWTTASGVAYRRFAVAW